MRPSSHKPSEQAPIEEAALSEAAPGVANAEISGEAPTFSNDNFDEKQLSEALDAAAAQAGIEYFAKRVCDVCASALLLIILGPLLTVTAIAIKFSSPGPVFFLQDRIGKNGKVFKIFKFRSMTTRDNGSVIKQAGKDDPRVTKVGKFLRSSSIDELPQLFNVIKGDMSLVGPRPHAVAHDAEFAQKEKDYSIRRAVLPGLTGLAQVNGYRGETDTPEKLQGRVYYDALYVKRYSFWLDIKIIFKTFFIVFKRVNAY